MREILFRGKRKDNGEWVEGSLVIRESIPYIRFEKPGVWFDDQEVIPETVGQYTGLNDRNGKKIFEGDVILVAGNIVEFCVGGFCINGDSLLAAWTRYDIIGNIHDNPEMRRVKSDE